MRRLIITITVLLLIDLFGAYDPAETLTIQGLFKAYDLTLLILLVPFVLSFALVQAKTNAIQVIKQPLIRLILYFFLLLIIISLNTLIQGGVTIKGVLQVARTYFPYGLAIIVALDASKPGGIFYYRKLILVIGAIATIMLILVVLFSLDLFSSWPNFRYGETDDYIEGVKRAYFTAFTFPVFATAIKGWDYFYERSAHNLFGLIFFMTGLFLQGFRSYIITSIAAFIIINFLQSQDNSTIIRSINPKVRSAINVTLLILFTMYIVSYLGLGFDKISQRLISAITDFVRMEGTFGYRILDDSFRWSVFSENKILGVGMVHHESARALAMGVKPLGMYSLGTTDSGYLDILIRFGVVGGLFFLYFVLLSTKRCLQISSVVCGQERSFALATATFVLVIFGTQVSHAGFTSLYGIVPLAVSFGLVEAMTFGRAQSSEHSK